MSVCSLKYPPVFFIGMPRSGTTIVFERFIEHKEFGWLSNYSEMSPGLPAMNLLRPLFDNKIINLRGHKKQYSNVRLGNRYLPQAVEAYNFWDLYTRKDFSTSFLHGEKAENVEIERTCKAVYKTLKYQGKYRFVTKLTGPGRISYLNSIFPDARFVHVIRDGRAVVGSLMKVGFWREKGGFDAPFWNNGLSDGELQPWKENNHPAILTALQWVKVVKSIRQDAAELNSDQYMEIRYEDFVCSPVELTNKLHVFAGKESDESLRHSSAVTATLADMNKNKLSDIDDSIKNIINELMYAVLNESGYEK